MSWLLEGFTNSLLYGAEGISSAAGTVGNYLSDTIGGSEEMWAVAGLDAAEGEGSSVANQLISKGEYNAITAGENLRSLNPFGDGMELDAVNELKEEFEHIGLEGMDIDGPGTQYTWGEHLPTSYDDVAQGHYNEIVNQFNGNARIAIGEAMTIFPPDVWESVATGQTELYDVFANALGVNAEGDIPFMQQIMQMSGTEIPEVRAYIEAFNAADPEVRGWLARAAQSIPGVNAVTELPGQIAALPGQISDQIGSAIDSVKEAAALKLAAFQKEAKKALIYGAGFYIGATLIRN